MRILIFGSSGFIGRNLVNSLSSNHELYTADQHGTELNLLLDMESYEEVNSAITHFLPDVIINLAARTDLMGTKLDDYKVNWEGIYNITKSIQENNISPFVIHFSSMLVCKMGFKPLTMTDYCPDTIYGQSKVKSENILLEESTNFPVLILRPTTVWGYDAGKPYSTFIKIIRLVGWLRLSLFDAKRDFCDIRNLNKLISQIIDSKDNLTRDYKRCFYISDSDKKSVNDLAEIIAMEKGSFIYKSNILEKSCLYIIKILSKFGDFLLRFSIKFPLNTRRIKNMNTSTNLPVEDLYKHLSEIS